MATQFNHKISQHWASLAVKRWIGVNSNFIFAPPSHQSQSITIHQPRSYFDGPFIRQLYCWKKIHQVPNPKKCSQQTSIFDQRFRANCDLKNVFLGLRILVKNLRANAAVATEEARLVEALHWQDANPSSRRHFFLHNSIKYEPITWNYQKLWNVSKNLLRHQVAAIDWNAHFYFNQLI